LIGKWRGHVDIEVVADAVDGITTPNVARRLKPNVMLMDILMPRMDGVEATTAIRAELPETQVIALTSVLDDAVVIAMVRAGAIGYLLKDTWADDRCRAIRPAALRQGDLSPAVAERLVREMRAPAGQEALTIREAEILRYVATGPSNKVIANRLSVGEKTVKTHVSNILSKLGFQSRTQAALYAVRQGLTSGTPNDRVTERPSPINEAKRRQMDVLAARLVRHVPASRNRTTINPSGADPVPPCAGRALRHPA
jgi:two-component system, NarL family, response regulator LiaR